MTDDLIGWLRQQIDEDERVAREVLADTAERGLEPRLAYDTRSVQGSVTTTVRHVVYEPDRVLREVAAKRTIITTAEWFRDRAAEVENERTYDVDDWRENDRLRVSARVLIDTLPVIAAVYSDRPGYWQEWAP